MGASASAAPLCFVLTRPPPQHISSFLLQRTASRVAPSPLQLQKWPDLITESVNRSCQSSRVFLEEALRGLCSPRGKWKLSVRV